MKYKPDERAPDIGAVIVCAGKGERTGLPYNKVLYAVGRKTVLESTLDKFLALPEISHVTVVAAQSDLETVKELTLPYPEVSVVTGGNTRSQSVYNGLKAHECDIVLIHDGARPFVDEQTIKDSIASAARYGSGIAAVPAVDTVKRINADGALASLPRNELYNVQTPQTFRYRDITNAYEKALATDRTFTDDAEVYEYAGYAPRPVQGTYENVKITTAGDLLRAAPPSCKIGAGFDLHLLVENRALILGGVEIDYPLGLSGHSDADVLTHAVMDALLSAADLPDIGVLFPDTDDKYLGVSSMLLLDRVVNEVKARGYAIGNVSAVVIAQQPKLAPVIYNIRKSLAAALGVTVDKVNVSASTTERLGIIGEGKAIAATASCILTENAI